MPAGKEAEEGSEEHRKLMEFREKPTTRSERIESKLIQSRLLDMVNSGFWIRDIVLSFWASKRVCDLQKFFCSHRSLNSATGRTIARR